jgi:hypothetical protein
MIVNTLNKLFRQTDTRTGRQFHDFLFPRAQFHRHLYCPQTRQNQALTQHGYKICLLPCIGQIVLVVNAIETTGVVDAHHQLRLDHPLPIPGHIRVRVIVLVPEPGDISESAWAEAVLANPAFDFLKDSEEDVYSATDGKPFDDKG